MRSFEVCFVFLTWLMATAPSPASSAEYGVDVSYPMHYPNVSINYDWYDWNEDPSIPRPEEYEGMVVQPLGNREEFYENLIKGCVEFYGPKGERCLNNERDRVQMSLRQPQSMVNYTKLGFTKIRAPDHVFKLLSDFWQNNKDKATKERWPTGNTYVNHWERTSKMVSVENESLKGGGFVLKQHIWNAARDTIQEWTGQQLAECSLYGIRVYEEGAVLATHVDRLPLVASAIINVDQNVTEPWPLEVIGHDGKAHNVTMEPGDLVLYESHSVLHGRPFPLKGEFMANVFIHFEPIGPLGGELTYGTTELPPYLVPGSPEEGNWRKRNPKGHKIMDTQSFATGSTEAHRYAMEGNLEKLRGVVKHHETVVNSKDENGWLPLHEAARGGHVEIIKYLLEQGSDVNAKTNDGSTPLFWAKRKHGNDHEVVSLLESYGGKTFDREL